MIGWTNWLKWINPHPHQPKKPPPIGSGGCPEWVKDREVGWCQVFSLGPGTTEKVKPSHHISTKLGKPDKDELIWIQVEEKGEEDGGFVVAVVFLLGIDQIHRLYNSSGSSYHEYPMICGLLFDVWCLSVVILIPSNTVQSHCLVTLQSYLIYN